MPKNKKKEEEKSPKAGKTRIGPMGYPLPPYPPATQGRQGKIMDEILKRKYGW